MPEKDFAVGSIDATGLNNKAALLSKPRYLIVLDAGDQVEHFIAFDKPDPQNGFISVKGIYSDKSEDKIQANFVGIIQSTPKEEYLDMMFPAHRVYSIRSLVFNANKHSTPLKKSNE